MTIKFSKTTQDQDTTGWAFDIHRLMAAETSPWQLMIQDTQGNKSSS